MTLARLPWTEQKKIAAWTACSPLDGRPPSEYRVDAYGNLIVWSHHGKQGDYGWEVDHVHPVGLGGPDALDNLRALHWKKNRQLGAEVPEIRKALGTVNAFAQGLTVSTPNAFLHGR